MRNETPQAKYMSRHFALNHPVLNQIKRQLVEQDLDFMSVSAVEARMLQFFVRTFGVRSVVEIGTLVGYSAVAMGLALPADGVIFGFEKEDSRAEEARSHLKEARLSCRFEVFAGPALEQLPQIEASGPFDLVFIDANKNDYVNYLDWAEKNTRSGSLIIGDNTFLFGALWGESRDGHVGEKQIRTMDEFNRRLGDVQKYDSILIPTLEGMTVGRRK